MRLAILCLLSFACGSAESPPPPAAPAPEAPAKKEAPAGAKVLVAGTIQAPETVPDAQAVFVSLRAPGRRGPPLAAKKLPAGPFPLSFTVTEADRPMANGPVPDRFEVKVTLDVDGNPMAKSPDDLESVVTGTLAQGDLSVTLAPRE